MARTSWPSKKVLRTRLSARDENRHLDIKREVNFRMSALIDRYWEQYASKKKSQDREKAVLEGIRGELGDLFVREVGRRQYSTRVPRPLEGKGCRREWSFGTTTSCTT